MKIEVMISVLAFVFAVFIGSSSAAPVPFAETKTIAVQIALDRRGYSSNTIDGQWGRKSQSALERYCADRAQPVPASADEAYDRFFSEEPALYGYDVVTADELAVLTEIPDDPAGKAALPRMGFRTIKEMYAER